MSDDLSTVGVPSDIPESNAPLREITIAGQGELPELELGRVLGEGGVGVVLEARQLALDRTVAVKCARSDRDDPTAAATIIREARIAGALTHPSVVPVHSLGRDADGRPLVVMAKVDGITWRALLRDPDHPLAEGDPLGAHLRILMQVCHAAHFAHSRGVLHRDIKPDNVMLGAFGEVYLVDWGLALEIDGAVTEGLAGTPGYLAPEMERDGAPLDARTDVYLLGAVLHEVVTGRRAAPETLPEDTPRELATIILRACERAPADRYPTADALRRALADFLVHRDALTWVDAAEARLAQLPATPEDEVDALLGEARLGFSEALRAWPDGERARAGLQRSVTRLVERELARDDPGAARHVLAQLPEPDASLSARVDAAVDRLDRLQAEARSRDARFGTRSRLILNSVMFVVFAIGPIIVGSLRSADLLPAEPPPFHRAPAALVAGILVLLATRLKVQVLDSGYNRRVVQALAVSTFGVSLTWTIAGFLGMGFHQVLPFVFAVLFTMTGTLAVALDARMLVVAPIFAVGGVLAAWQPSLAEQILGVANGLTILWLFWSYRRASPS